LRFFDEREETTARPLVDRLLAQDGEARVPVLEMVDARLAEGRGFGYRYADMPEDGRAWRASLRGLDLEARAQHECTFAELAPQQQIDLLEGVRSAKEEWHGLNGKRLFSLWMTYCCDAFYSHPFAFNEIGFPGPAYPRGYKNLGLARREPFERPEIDAHDPVPWADRKSAATARRDVPPPGTRAR
jgi:hypothetical protein